MDERLSINLPTEEGYKYGGLLAEFVAHLREQDPSLPMPCIDCAFRAGTIPNGCERTLSDVLRCLTNRDEVFDCHVTDRTCAGFLIMQTQI